MAIIHGSLLYDASGRKKKKFKPSQKTKAKNFNGVLSLVNGSKLFNSPATYNIKPKVGEFYFFPNYLMHVVYPFSKSNEERRSISFNAT